jgi:thiosulfate/3-mercaptopyruvate sulfurtransferase
MAVMPPIVTLRTAQRDFPAAIYCDVRYSLDNTDGYQAYLQGHIPGARYVSMDRVLAATPGPIVGRHPLPTAEAFAQSLGQLGIPEDAPVIAYDAVGGRFAGRLVWMLRILGQPAGLLDGGLQAWIDQVPSQPLETQTAQWQECLRPARPWPEDQIVSADEVAAAIASGSLVADARAPERYRGEVEPIDKKAGHIPGAINLFLGGNYRDGGNYFKSSEELARRFKQSGFSAETICYCGSGVTACNNVLAAEAAGLPRPRVYVGSWSGWSSDEKRPVATGHS